MGSGLSQFSTTSGGSDLQGLLHLSELRGKDSVDDLHDELDRASQKDFRRVTRMRGAMPNEESVLLLMGKTAMDKKSSLRPVPRINLDRDLFPE